jgi:Uma2 family endonuclease
MAEALPAGAAVGSAAPAEPISFEQFLDWCDEDTHAEWRGGRVVVMSPATRGHARLVSYLSRLLGYYMDVTGAGEVLGEPFQMRLAAAKSSRSPDLMLVAAAHRDRIAELYLDGPADLVIEVLSPGSRGRDRGEKYYEYEQAGVPEYWLLDASREQAEFYQLDAEGRYRAVAPDGGVYRSAVFEGLWLEMTWLWRGQPLPQVVAAWGLAGC